MNKIIGMMVTLLVLCGLGLGVYYEGHNKKSEAMQIRKVTSVMVGPKEKIILKKTVEPSTQVEPDRNELIIDREVVEKKVPESDTISYKEVTLTKKELSILYQIVEAEATGGDKKSKRLVCQVILNRVKDKSFPNSIEEVVFQKTGNTAQFSPVSDGRIWSVTVTKSTKKAVHQVLDGKDESQGALFFANRSSAKGENMQWFDTYLQYQYSYGGHEYFCLKE